MDIHGDLMPCIFNGWWEFGCLMSYAILTLFPIHASWIFLGKHFDALCAYHFYGGCMMHFSLSTQHFWSNSWYMACYEWVPLEHPCICHLMGPRVASGGLSSRVPSFFITWVFSTQYWVSISAERPLVLVDHWHVWCTCMTCCGEYWFLHDFSLFMMLLSWMVYWWSSW